MPALDTTEEPLRTAVSEVSRELTAGEQESLSRYYVSYDKYEAMRLLVHYEDAKLLSRLPLSGKRVLELGCGSLPVLLATPEPDYTYVGADLSEGGLRLAKRLAPAGRFYVCDATSPGRLPGPFDVILMKNLLHHLERPEDCLVAARRLLAPGGTVVVLEPNSNCVTANAAKALLRVLGRGVEESPYGQYSVARLREAFRAAGLEVTKVRHSAPLAFPLSGDYGSLKLVPMSARLWRGIIALDRVVSAALLSPEWLAPLMGFKVIFHLRPREDAARAAARG